MSRPKAQTWSKCSCHENASLFGKEKKALKFISCQSPRETCLEGVPISSWEGFFLPPCAVHPPDSNQECLERVAGAPIPSKPATVIKRNREAFNYQHISILRMEKQPLVYNSSGIGKKCLFVLLIKRILLNS